MPRSSPPGFTLSRIDRHDDVSAARGGGEWFRQPIAWLGAAVFAASLLGCVVLIVASQ
jgi:hypothetical protein